MAPSKQNEVADEQRPDTSKPGPKGKLTRALLDEVIRLIQLGNYPEVACGAVGIGRTTFYRWKLEAESAPDGSLLQEFGTAVVCATDMAEASMVERIAAGDDKGESFGPAKARLELLSRRFPKRWAQRVKHEIDDANRLIFEAVKRVCREENREDILVRICAELSRSDSEGDSAEPTGEELPMH